MDNFPLVHMHYPGGCKEPDYLTSAVDVNHLHLPDDWHVTPKGNVVRTNPNANIKIISRTFTGDIYNAVLRLNPNKITEGFLGAELVVNSEFLNQLILPYGCKLADTNDAIISNLDSSKYIDLRIV